MWRWLSGVYNIYLLQWIWYRLGRVITTYIVVGTMQYISVLLRMKWVQIALTRTSTLATLWLIRQSGHEPSPSSYAKQATFRAYKQPQGLSLKMTHNNKCVINYHLLACQYILVSLKTFPSGLDAPNREVDVTPWPLPKHGEVEVQRSELVSALAPHRVGHVWFSRAPGLWFPWPDMQLNILPLLSNPPLTSCLSALLPCSSPRAKLRLI